jgi:conjugative transposon TraK protein
MFRKMKNIDTTFRDYRRYTLIVITGSILANCFIAFEYERQLAVAQNRVHILAAGKILTALASDRRDNLSVEARDHIRTFHELFFSLDPDDKVIQANTTKALYLADESAKKEYDNLTESGYYASIISGNISQQVKVDSVNFQADTYHFRCYATLQIIRTTSTVTRSLVTEGSLRLVSRSDNNPHGFLIEHWATLENKDLKIVNH